MGAATLNHVRRGAGEPVVLVHGLGSWWRVWEPVLDRIAAEREVIALDLPGGVIMDIEDDVRTARDHSPTCRVTGTRT